MGKVFKFLVQMLIKFYANTKGSGIQIRNMVKVLVFFLTVQFTLGHFNGIKDKDMENTHGLMEKRMKVSGKMEEWKEAECLEASRLFLEGILEEIIMYKEIF